MSSTKNSQDIIREAKEYTFGEAAKEFANPNTDEKSIQAVNKILCEAAITGKLKANLIFLPNNRYKILYDVIRSTEKYKTWKKESNIANDDPRTLTEEYFKHVNHYKKELFEIFEIDLYKSSITGGNIREFCVSEGIIHPYFNPETVTPDPKPEPKPDTPADPAPEAGTTPNESNKPEIMSVPPEKYVLEPKPEVAHVADSENKPTKNAKRERWPDIYLGIRKKTPLEDYEEYKDIFFGLKSEEKEIARLRFEYGRNPHEIAIRIGKHDSHVSRTLKRITPAIDAKLEKIEPRS